MNHPEWELEFYHRFSRHEAELRHLYSELYHHDTRSYESFVDMLYRAYLDRPEALKARGRSGAAKEARHSGPYRKTGG